MQVHYDLGTLPSFNNAVLTVGSFDGVHKGHVSLLNQLIRTAKQNKGETIAVTFHPHPRLVLANQPNDFAILSTMKEKIELLALTGIDHLVIVPFSVEFSILDATAYLFDFLMDHFNPLAIVIGYDHRYGAGRKGDLALMKKLLEPKGVHIVEIDPLLIDDIAISSSAIRRALVAGDIATVNNLSGHPYTIKARVVKGDQIGRTIGFPTANLQLDETYKALPADGIYAAKVQLGNKVLESMAYLGHRPVIGTDLQRNIEVHIFDFDEDIYGRELNLLLFEKIRDDKKLDGLNALEEQLKLDKISVEKYFQKIDASNHHPDISVIVLNYNTVHHLQTFLPDLIAHTPNEYIVIVDNGSNDGSKEYLQKSHPSIRQIHLDKNYGFTGGYNKAIAQINSRYVLLLNSDVRVTPDWLPPLIALLDNNPAAAIVQPKILSAVHDGYFDYAGAAGGWMDQFGYPFCRGRIFEVIEKDSGQYDDATEVFWASGAAMLIRRHIYEKLGGLDDTFFAHMEEIDLAWRVKRCGYSVWVAPQSVIHHLGGGTLDSQSSRKLMLNFKNSLTVLLKNESTWRLFPVIFIRLCLDGIAGIRFLTQGKWSHINAILKSHYLFYLYLPRHIKERFKQSKLIQIHTIGPQNNYGRWAHSIVFAHFAKKRNIFSQLPFLSKNGNKD